MINKSRFKIILLKSLVITSNFKFPEPKPFPASEHICNWFWDLLTVHTPINNAARIHMEAQLDHLSSLKNILQE